MTNNVSWPIIRERWNVFPLVTVGIPVLNDNGFLGMLLSSIKWYTVYPNYRIVVVDDGSEEEHEADTRELALAHGAEYLRHPVNRGVSAAWNTIVESARNSGSECVAILNSDTLMTPGWLTCATFALIDNVASGRIGSVFWEPINVPHDNAIMQYRLMMDKLWHAAYQFGHVNYAGPSYVTQFEQHCGYDRLATWGLARVLAPNGCNFAARVETFDRVGLFDEDMKAFHEESDWGTRCGAAGMFSLGIPFPRTYHVGSQTFRDNKKTVDAAQRFQESRAVFLRKHDIPLSLRSGNDHFAYVTHKYLDVIPKTDVRYLRTNWSKTAVNVGGVTHSFYDLEIASCSL